MAHDRPPCDSQPPSSDFSSEPLRCSVCDKGFEQRSSRDRHFRRCRQKQIWGSVPRKKSCAICTQAKTRCDLQTPACSRCRTKGLSCHYYHQPQSLSQTTSLTTAPAQQPLPAHSPTTQLVRRSPGLRTEHEASIPTPAYTDCGQADDIAHHGSLREIDLTDWGGMNQNLLDWSIFGGPTVDLELRSSCSIASTTHTPMSPATPYMAQYMPDEQPHTHLRLAPSRQSFTQPKQMRKQRILSDVCAPLTTLPTKVNKEKFVFMDRVVRGYPKMMTSRNSPPPFIHASHLIPGRISSALANCRTLVDMYKTMTPDNKLFVMRTIAQEHSRILDEADHPRCNETEKVGALQAALVYGLIRHYEFDLSMDKQTILSTETMALSIGLRGMTLKGEIEGERPNWEEWILIESKRRTLVTIYILSASYHNARNIPSQCPNFNHVLLPAIRALWESTDRSKWEFEYENYLADLAGRRLPRFGDLFEAGTDYADLEEWLGGMDVFGVTVMALVEMCRMGGD